MRTKLIATLVMALLLGSSAVADTGGNSVYIDQTNADQSTVSITQTGSNNNVGDSNTSTGNPFVIDGNSMSLTINQNGMNNSILGNFIGGNSTMSINQDGNSNASVLNMGNMGTASGNYTLDLLGNNNSTTLNIGTTHDAGNYNFSAVVTGDSNTMTNTINSKRIDNTFTVTGDSNTITTTQIGNNGTISTKGHNIATSIIGDSNVLNISQDGVTNPNSVTVNVTGSNTTTNITQH